MCVPDAQHRDAQCPASRPRRAVCTSSGVRLKRSSALMSAPFSRSHSDTLKEPSLAARCLRACHTAGWDGAHWMHRESGETLGSVQDVARNMYSMQCSGGMGQVTRRK